MRFYLASTSPRRKDLLSTLGIPFEVVSPTFIEHETTLSPPEEALTFAEEKARSIAPADPNALILGCDTLVACDGQKLGKPSDVSDARRILKILSGKTHQVHTAIVLINTKTGLEKKHIETTEVAFRELSDSEIDAYIESGEPFGKAGAYAIQGKARGFIAKIEGDEESVVGLPLKVLREWLGSEP